MSLKIWKSANKTNENDFSNFFCTKTLIGHEHSISFIYNIPETEITVSCSRDKTIKFWDRSNNYCRRTIEEHEEWVRCCDSNKQYFLSSGNDKKVFVFSLDSLINFEQHNTQVDLLNVFEVHDNYVESVKIFQEEVLWNCKTICVTASRDKTIGIWNFMQGTQFLSLVGHENWVKDLCLIEKFHFIVSVGEDKTLRIWNLDKKKQVFIKKNSHEHFVMSLDYHKNFRICVSGGVDKNSNLWKLQNCNPDEIFGQMLNQF